MIPAIISSAVVLLILLIITIKVRNKAFKLKNDIKENRSNLRLVKSKYLSVIELSDSVHMSVANKANSRYSPSGDFIIGSGSSAFIEGNRMVESLAGEYLEMQKRLNFSIKTYNEYISRFPRMIFARIVGYKKENYLEEDDLEKEMIVNSNIDNIGL